MPPTIKAEGTWVLLLAHGVVNDEERTILEGEIRVATLVSPYARQ